MNRLAEASPHIQLASAKRLVFRASPTFPHSPHKYLITRPTTAPFPVSSRKIVERSILGESRRDAPDRRLGKDENVCQKGRFLV
jgi:hypothetical protein